MINLEPKQKKQKDLEVGDIIKNGDRYSIILTLSKRDDIGLIRHTESNPQKPFTHRSIFERRYNKRDWDKKITVYAPIKNAPKFQIF